MVDIVVQVVDEKGALPTSQCDVTYNSRNRPATISENGWTLELSYGSGLQREKSVLKNGNTPVCTTYFISKDSELEIKPSSTRYIDYIYAEGRIVALHVHNTTANADSLYYVQTDLLGSWDRIVNGNRQVVQRSHFDPWGNRMSATNWTQRQDGTSLAFRRGFTGHEHYDRFGIINMNARLYDPVLGRFFSPDPQVQSPFSTQGYNRYSYCGNNPVMYVDEDGESFLLIAACVGAAIGMYSGGVLANGGEFKPWEWNFSSSTTWGYMLGGAAAGFLSGCVGGVIAASQIPMANTFSIMASSFINSIGTSFYTGGRTPNSINFGFASYDFTNNSWGYLFKRGNKWYENIGYGFGSMANLSDMVSLIYGGGENLNVNAANKKEGDHDWYSHISITRMDESTLLSIGPNEEYSRYIDVIFGSIDADKGYPSYISDKRIWSVKLTNISSNAIQSYSARVTGWNLMLNSCVGHATRALWCAGVPVIYLFHPYMLNVQLIIRQLGIYSSPYLYQF